MRALTGPSVPALLLLRLLLGVAGLVGNVVLGWLRHGHSGSGCLHELLLLHLHLNLLHLLQL